jgi:hypothetical protein
VYSLTVTDESSFLDVNRRTWQPSRVTHVMVQNEVLSINHKKGQEGFYEDFCKRNDQWGRESVYTRGWT